MIVAIIYLISKKTLLSDKTATFFSGVDYTDSQKKIIRAIRVIRVIRALKYISRH